MFKQTALSLSFIILSSCSDFVPLTQNTSQKSTEKTSLPDIAGLNIPALPSQSDNANPASLPKPPNAPAPANNTSQTSNKAVNTNSSIPNNPPASLNPDNVIQKQNLVNSVSPIAQNPSQPTADTPPISTIGIPTSTPTPVPVTQSFSYSISSNTTITDGNSFWNKQTIKIVAQLNGDKLDITLFRIDGTSFTTSSDVFLKVGTYENFGVDHTISRVILGEYSTKISDTLSNYAWPETTKNFYITLQDQNGGWSWCGPIIVTRK